MANKQKKKTTKKTYKPQKRDRYGDMRNNEGYYDPTAGQAMRNISRQQKRFCTTRK